MHSLVSFVINSILLGVGLAMDAFSVSMANGLNAPKMSRSMRIMIPLTFAVFQFLMPVIGWFCVRSVAEALGVATSIDALSVGFTIAEYHVAQALAAGLIIGGVTFVICSCGLRIGQRFGTRLAGKASILGGVILIGIGIEIFITGVLGG